MTPPFQITPFILNYSLKIAEYLGMFKGVHYASPPIELRRTNQLKGIQSSLAIEGNTLSLHDVETIFEHKPIIANQREILEVKNALAVYQKIASMKYDSMTSFKQAHQLLMKGLIKDAGRWRAKDVGVFAGKLVSHMAPPKNKIPSLMRNLFLFLKKNNDISLLIKACVFHYEIEFIHPFLDGNGRMGRLWQQVILRQFNQLFEFIPIESLIKDKQDDYYRVLKRCDHAGESTLFIEFMLPLIYEAIQLFYHSTSYQVQTTTDRLAIANKTLTNQPFARKDYLNLFKNISTATASRDLAYGVKKKLLKKSGNKAKTLYQFIQDVV